MAYSGSSNYSTVHKFPLNRENKYRARLSFQPIQVVPKVSGGGEGEDAWGLTDYGTVALGTYMGYRLAKKGYQNYTRDSKVAERDLSETEKSKYPKSANVSTRGDARKYNLKRGAGKFALVVGGAQLVSFAAEKAAGALGTDSLPVLSDVAFDVADAGREHFLQTNTKFTLQYERIDEKVKLHVPTNLQFSDGVQVGSQNLGALGAMGLSALSYGDQGLISSFFAGATEFGSDFLAGLGAGSRSQLSDDAVRITAQRLGTLLPGQGGLQAGVDIATQMIANPNSRSIFQNVNIRQFSFAFKLIPLSKEESREVERIITFFRKYMYPEHAYLRDRGAEGTQVPVGYKYPPLFDIHVGYDIEGSGTRYQNLPNMEIHYCYLTNVTHNYNPSSQTWYEGGKPTEIDLTLQFTEYRTLSRYDIENEYGTAKDINGEMRS